ncbi:hypothetical protein HGA91_06445 [candidate division WWE3 bacterium]|nr:hypothetical protein [candidate division WWE3 bacterium]
MSNPGLDELPLRITERVHDMVRTEPAIVAYTTVGLQLTSETAGAQILPIGTQVLVVGIFGYNPPRLIVIWPDGSESGVEKSIIEDGEALITRITKLRDPSA